MPPAAQIHEALERVVSSDVFARSERARDLLRYLVEQDLAGHADRLKGYSIAVDVFGKDASFDPSTDTVVRVQAGRLRDLLDHYYAEEGAQDSVRIAVPRGSYTPSYCLAEPPEILPPQHDVVPTVADAGDVSPAPAAPTVRRPWVAYGVGSVLALTLVLAAVFQWGAASRLSADEVQASAHSLGPRPVRDLTSVRDFLPAIYLEVQGKGEDVERLAAVFRRGLSGFDTISFIAREPGSRRPEDHLKTDYVFLLKNASGGGIHIELQNVVSGTVLLSRNLNTRDRSEAELEDEVADLLTTVTPVSGVIYASVAEDGAETKLIRCLILNELYYRDPKAAAHQEVYQCLRDVVDGNVKSSLAYSELAGLHMQAISARYSHLPDATEAQALAFSRMAVQLAPNSPYAHRSMGYVLSRSSTPDEAMRWTRKAYELNMFDLSVAASYGYELIFDGIYDEGTPILQRAVNAASAHPPWWDYALALGHLMRDETQAAANTAAALSASPRAHYRALRLVLAQELGLASEVEVLLGQLRRGNANFIADPLNFFERGGYPEDMTQRLLQGLREAGLVDAS